MGRPVRRSQAISPFGIGALVDFPGPVSLIHAGLDAWPFHENDPRFNEFKIEDEKRLARRLGVDFLVQPPDFRQPERGQDASQANLNLKLPFLRFPLWHVCPRCGRMFHAQYHEFAPRICKGPIGSGGQKGGQHPPRKTIQVRFVAACRNGHLQDFPWLQWLFKEAAPDWKPENDMRWLRLRSTGSASLTGVEITAEEQVGQGEIRTVAKRTLAGAFQGDEDGEGRSAFTKIGVSCEGHNPALAIGVNGTVAPPGCGQTLYPLLRGASNLYFPHVVSSIYIPDIQDSSLTEDILDLLDDYCFKQHLIDNALNSEDGLVSERSARNILNRYNPETDVDARDLADAVNRTALKDVLLGDGRISAFLLQKIKASVDKKLTVGMVSAAIESLKKERRIEWNIDPSYLMPAMMASLDELPDDSGEGEARQDSLAEVDYRRQEYNVFCRDIEEGIPKTNLLIRSSPIEKYDDLVRSSFDRVSLLHKLRETRAFVGYSRIYPENDLTKSERLALISRSQKRWLPAVIVRGEGIFLRFREDMLADWLREHGSTHVARLAPVAKNIADLRSRRKLPPKEISPKYVLIHTFSHILINELVYKCGYGSASLRERIYATDGDNGMSGILIYTAAGDSEGTMGGLVKMGQTGHLESVIASAIEKTGWCSSDPVCIESKGQGPDNCNLAACHSCALLPETSCEEQNRLLDRGVLVGTIDKPNIGFFSRSV